MRWNTSFNGALEATPVTLQSREEDVYHPHHQLHAHYPPAKRSGVPTKPARIAQLSARSSSVTTTTPSETIRLSATVVPSVGLSATSDAVGGGGFLVCAGRGVSSDTPRSNNAHDDLPLLPVSLVNQHVNEAPPKSQRGLQRSDSELELIISELREKIAQQQLTQGAEEEEPRSHQLSRRHLKNPVERMHIASSNSLPLRRQPSASQVHASRLVSEGSAGMVTPVGLSSSASRGALGRGAAHSAQYPQHPAQHYTALDTEDATDAAGGFRIRSYADGVSSSGPTLPHFVSSASLGIGLPTHPQPLQPPPRGPDPPESAVTARRPAKPRMRTLADLDLELDRSDPEHDSSELTSPVGPWVVDRDTSLSTPLTTTRSTASLSPSSSSMSLQATRRSPAPAELSPRSRLLWLADCGSDDEWGAPTSARVMALLRPGSSSCSPSRRPASAVDSRRRHGKALKATTPVKPRAASAKPAVRKAGSNSSNSSNQETSGRQRSIVRHRATSRISSRP